MEKIGINYCEFLVNFMNINTEHSGSAQGFSPLFKCEASPYLSPLFGTASLRQLSSQEDFTQFRLEQDIDEPNEEVQVPEAQIHENNQIQSNMRDILEYIEPIKLATQPEKPEVMTPVFVPKPNSSPIYSIICFLVENDDLPEQQSLSLGKQIYQNCQKYENIFRILLSKFKKLRKTKEEMIKFCMRKAFKHSSDCRKSPKGSRPKKSLERNQQKHNCSLQMPFRKNSAERTMNSQFLRQVFRSPDFYMDYANFLQHLTEIIEEDNSSKVQYLSDTIQKMLLKDDISELQNIKRLPWTKTILRRTEKLAKSLMVDFSPRSTQQEAANQTE